MQGIDLNTLAETLGGGADGPTAVILQSVPELIVIAVISLLVCFLGLNLFRLINILVALTFAAALGIVVISLASNVPAGLVTMGVTAIALIVLSFIFRKFGAFVVSIAYLAGFFLLAVRPQNWILLAVCAVVTVLASVLSFFWPDAVIIAVTGLYGGWNLSGAVLSIVSRSIALTGPAFRWGGFAVVTLLGILVQCAMHSGKVKRREVSRAQEVREELSKESEIDRARAILDEDDED